MIFLFDNYFIITTKNESVNPSMNLFNFFQFFDLFFFIIKIQNILKFQNIHLKFINIDLKYINIKNINKLIN